MRTYALVNQKGGVGKTTTAISLGAELGLGDPAEVTEGTYDALIARVPASDCVLHSPNLKLTLLPSSPALAGAQVEMVGMDGREGALNRALAPMRGHFSRKVLTPD